METDFSNFVNLDIRIGTIIKAEPAQTNKPTYRMIIDFGPEIGTKVSCGAYTNYATDSLPGKRVVGIVNFASRKMGPEISEVLVLGVHDPNSTGTLFLTVDKDAPNGSKIF
jgi:tRNA-binding protein